MEQIIKNYFRNNAMRESLNVLTRKTFEFDFEAWYEREYYTGDYIPYSLVIDGKVVSNASANIMKFSKENVDGTFSERNYIQIGTVMTAKEHRKKGYAGRLIKEIIMEFKGKCDGFYLFGNLNACDFYSGLGFNTMNQYMVTSKSVVVKQNCNTCG